MSQRSNRGVVAETPGVCKARTPYAEVQSKKVDAQGGVPNGHRCRYLRGYRFRGGLIIFYSRGGTAR